MEKILAKIHSGERDAKFDYHRVVAVERSETGGVVVKLDDDSLLHIDTVSWNEVQDILFKNLLG